MKLASTTIALLLVVLMSGDFALANNNHNHAGHASSRAPGALPAWNLRDADRREVSSEQFSGKTHVLVLHLGEGCLHCAEQLQALNARLDEFNQLEVEVVAVSTDDSARLSQQLKGAGDAFALQHLLADPEMKLFQDVDAFDEETGKPLHATLLIDAAGRVRWSNIGLHPFMDMDKLIRESSFVSVGATTIQEDEDPDRPKVFLNKSPRIVAFQLDRLSNERLLKVKRKTDDKIYIPVWKAILTRAGMPGEYRKEAVKALVKLEGGAIAQQLISALGSMKSDKPAERKGSRELANMLLRLDTAELAQVERQLVEATKSKNSVLAMAGFAGLVGGGLGDKAIETSRLDKDRSITWLRSIRMIRSRKQRDDFRDQVLSQIDSKNMRIQKEAILAMRHFSVDQAATWNAVAAKVGNAKLRDVAVETLLALPNGGDKSQITNVVETLLASVESMNDAKRTENSALNSIELMDELISGLSKDEADPLRKRLSSVAVRIVRIKTIKEEMRYDVPYFAVEAGRPVQIILDNQDLMPHNLIVCKPGQLKKVAMDGLKAGPQNGKDGKQYVPKSRDVLFATDMVQANRKERLTFTAPKKIGAYPYVCTFPQHWSRMYGVMVVVDNLEAWEKSPVKPEDPIGNKRQLVKKWTMDDFKDEMKQDLSQLSVESGKRIFTEATCAQCHKLGDYGGAGANVGPALDDLYERWKNDRSVALNHIFEPSSHVDPKYQMYIIATDDGLTRNGLIVSQDDEKIELLESGSVSKTTTILKEEIDEMAASKKSIMPKALLDNFTKEEILEMINYLEKNQK